MATTTTPVRIVTFPSGDAAFRAHVETVVVKLGGRLAHSSIDTGLVAAQVRAAYPGVTIVARNPFAEVYPDGTATWYAYRDGRARVPDNGEWWSGHDPSLPRLEIDATGTYVAANAAAADLVGRPIGEIVGSRIGRFTRHEPDPEPGMRAFDVLARDGALESTAVVVRADGTELPVEYRIVVASGGSYEMVMRPVPERVAGR